MVKLIYTGTLETRVQISAAPLHFHLTKNKGEDIMAAKKLTRFERARLIGARALQLSMGAKPQVKVEDAKSIDPIDIALLELAKNKMPLDVRRLTQK